MVAHCDALEWPVHREASEWAIDSWELSLDEYIFLTLIRSISLIAIIIAHRSCEDDDAIKVRRRAQCRDFEMGIPITLDFN